MLVQSRSRLSSPGLTLRTGKDVKRKGKGLAQVEVEHQLQSRRESKMDAMGTCTYVKVRHILTDKMGLISEVYKRLQDGWLNIGHRVPPAEFAKLAQKFSECKSAKLGGDLGWIPRAAGHGWPLPRGGLQHSSWLDMHPIPILSWLPHPHGRR